MKKGRLLLAALAAFPLASNSAEQNTANNSAPAAQATQVPRISQDKLDRIRKALVAQIAVYEPAELAMRSPTAGEAAALAIPSSGSTPSIVNLGGGSVALQGDMSTASLLMALRGGDGKVKIAHEPASKSATGGVKKGDGHAH